LNGVTNAGLLFVILGVAVLCIIGRTGVMNDADAGPKRSGVSGAAAVTKGGAASGCVGRERGFSGLLACANPGFVPAPTPGRKGDLKGRGFSDAFPLSVPGVGDAKAADVDEEAEGRENPMGLGVPGESYVAFSRLRKAGRSGDARRDRGRMADAVLKRFSGPIWDSVTTGAGASVSSAQMASIFSLAFASAVLEGSIHPLLEAFMNPMGAS
jgi:hypothetical protein